MPTQLWRLCVCHLLTWFSYIAEAVFFTDFMGQVIYQGNPMVCTLKDSLVISEILSREISKLDFQ